MLASGSLVITDGLQDKIPELESVEVCEFTRCGRFVGDDLPLLISFPPECNDN